MEAEILEVFKRFEEVEVLTLTEIVISYHGKHEEKGQGRLVQDHAESKGHPR